MSAQWEPVTGGNCEAMESVPWRQRGCGKRARWQGPQTVTGGNLWCGQHKREYETKDALRRRP